MQFEHIEARIEAGTKLAIFGNKLSSKEKHHKYFSGRWLIDEKAAIEHWDKIISKLREKFEISITERYFEDLDKIRTEATIIAKLSK